MTDTPVVNQSLICFLLPDTRVTANGQGQVVTLGPLAGKPLLVTLGITRIIEQESLDVAIHGSANGEEWGAVPLLAFPQKFYCGTYQMVLDLASRPEIHHLRVEWKVNRWGRGTPTPLFEFYVAAEALKGEAARA